MRPSRAPEVTGWFGRKPRAMLFTTALSQAEILYGLELLPEGRRRDDLIAAALPVFEEDLGGRVLPFDTDAAACGAAHLADRCADRSDRPRPRGEPRHPQRRRFRGLWHRAHQPMGRRAVTVIRHIG